MTKRGVADGLERWKWVVALVAAIAALSALFAAPAEARRHHHSGRAYHARHSFIHHAAHHRRGGAHLSHAARRGASTASGGGPAFAAIVVDANSGRTLYARNEHELRHPASVTKVMTLYLLFEQLEKGRLRLDSPLVISSHAAAQAPTKLGLAPGQTIDVDSAIKAVVTKSANDIAAAIAENIAGDEETFADMMTRKAHQLGMSRTHYANASGLPNDEQITTAHDLSVLGRAIQDRFPRYYRYFSTHAFVWRGQSHRNHNHLLGQIRGVDGIKTGYTHASGFNLLTSVRRDGHHIVAVVMGGRTAAARDRVMAGLIAEHIGDGAAVRTARAISEGEPAPAPVARAEEEKEETPIVAAAVTAPAAPAPAAAGPALAPRVMALASAPPLLAVPTPERADKIRPAFVAGGHKAAEPAPVQAGRRQLEPARRDSARATTDGSTAAKAGHATKLAAVTTPNALPARMTDTDRTLVARSDRGEPSKAEQARPNHSGWMIQIGATDDAEKAQQLLSRARAKGVPATAKAFTEKVQKGRETLYRARFAGLEEKSAETACRALKRSGFSCFTTKN
ncbi:D-alanyl-D-alanine carboxypeptidase [Methylosinus sporium]|uniref:D-alanyl-D-alanine carboxypeptidase n=1 Tax=Methylosinus sporium TaxID=428 RepID=A0A549T7L2_METSR|nr:MULTISPECIES: SPOR domain-containing protein [Methylosinus]MBU3887276.1 D-alanyl-D-alanine carboxypeptidase [Methylosinus sp. KRF6]TRL37863.1 D-alanyl-D-alanine carboxypeptidase [Methylosinus sporium]